MRPVNWGAEGIKAAALEAIASGRSLVDSPWGSAMAHCIHVVQKHNEQHNERTEVFLLRSWKVGDMISEEWRRSNKGWGG